MKFALLSLFSAAVLCGQQASIMGTVRNEITGAPVRHAQVSIHAQANATLVAETDGGGRFSASSLTPGRYYISANHPDFPSIRRRPPVVVDLTQPDERQDVTVNLRPGCVVTGRVLNEAGEPKSGVSVELLQKRSRAGTTEFITPRSARSDDLGQFRLYRIPPGRYWLRARGGSEEPPARPFGPPPAPGDPVKDTQLIVYYPDSATFSEASQLHLTAGQVLEGTELRLRPTRGTVISGSVTPPPGQDDDVTMVVLLPRDPLQAILGQRTGAGPKTGSFWLGPVPPGSYWLAATRQNDKGTEGAWEALEVGEEPPQPIRLMMRPPMRLEGRIEWDGRPLALPQGLRVHLNRPDPGMGGSVSGKVSDGGGFTLEGVLPGLSFLYLGRFPGTFLKSAWLGNQEVQPREIMIQPGVGPLRIVLSSRGAVLDGQVDGLPQAGVLFPAGTFFVLLIPSGTAEDNAVRRTAMLQPDGRFRIEGIVPGEYRLYAASNELSDPALLEELAGKSEKLKLSEGETANVRLSLIPGEAVEAAWRKIE